MLRLRSPIFVPGNRRNMLEKAIGFVTDYVVPDLEDSVPPSEKDAARALVSEMAPVLGKAGQRVIVRVNALETGLTDRDLEAVVGPAVQAISVGKIRSGDEVREYDRRLAAREAAAGVASGATRLVLWLESAPAIQHAYAIATASPRVAAITFGAEDYSKDLQIQRTEEGRELYFPRAMLALAAHAARVTPLDTPYVNFRDAAGLEIDIREALSVGFKGKFAIHPAQLPVIRRMFAPQPEEVAYARRIVEGWERASAEGRGSFDLDGKVVDIPVVERARQLLAEAETVAAG
jgi:citrate lyase subunit beta/citryl-CoA lyase